MSKLLRFAASDQIQLYKTFGPISMWQTLVYRLYRATCRFGL